jgi:hypothetical protein
MSDAKFSARWPLPKIKYSADFDSDNAAGLDSPYPKNSCVAHYKSNPTDVWKTTDSCPPGRYATWWNKPAILFWWRP